MGILSIISLLASVLGSVLESRGIIGANTDNLITSLVGSAGTLITNLQAGVSKSQDALAVLGALSGVIATLKATTGISADTLTQLDGLDLDVQKALAAYVQSAKGVDLSVLTPIAPVV